MNRIAATLAVAMLVSVGCNTQSTTVKSKEGKEITLVTPNEVTVNQDGTTEFKVSLNRKDYPDPVAITFEDFPEGVSVTDKSYKFEKDTKEHTFTLKADKDAKVVTGHALKVTANKGGEPSATHSVKIKVNEAKVASLDQKREELKTSVKKQMVEIDQSLKTLDEKAKVATDETKTALNKQLETLRERRADLNKNFEKIGTTTANAWDDFSQGLNNAAVDLSNATKKAVDQYK
jgi:hypothetical protein